MWQLINQTRLSQWFDSRSRHAQELLPQLLRKLIRETVPPEQLAGIRAPADDNINLPGFDLEVELTCNHPFVPCGHSAWEVGTSNSPKKAQKDFKVGSSD